MQVQSLGRKDPLEKNTLLFLPRKSHGQKSLVGYSPRGRRELDTTEHRVVVNSKSGLCIYKAELLN